MINVVLDVNVILDMWLARGDTTAIDRIIEANRSESIRCWVSACSLPIAEYVCIASLKKESVAPKEAKVLTRKLLAALLSDVSVLCAYEPTHVDALLASSDMEDAQIALAASTLPGAVYVLTRDKHFDTQGKIISLTPEQALSPLNIP